MMGRAWPNSIRHWQVWLDISTLQALGAAWPGTSEEFLQFESWVGNGKPLIGRASGFKSCATDAFVGWCAMPLAAKRRVPVQVARTNVIRIAPPILLADALPILPAFLVPVAREVCAAAQTEDLEARVYGSAFWSWADNHDGMTDRSDIDLVFYPRGRLTIHSLLDRLLDIDARSSGALDGEFMLPCGWGVSWKELARSQDTVLVRTDSTPELVKVEKVWESLV